MAFKGFSNNYYIIYDASRQSYILTMLINFDDQKAPIDGDKIIGVLLLSKTNNGNPIGLQTWKINEEICNQQTIQLKLTSVRLYLSLYIISIMLICIFSV